MSNITALIVIRGHMEIGKKTLWKIVGRAALVAWSSCFPVMGQGINTSSKWDADLLAVSLTNVHLRSDSMRDAWQKQISYHLAIRTVLFGISTNEARFEFDADQCKVRDVLDAFVTTYSDFTYTQDKSTGVIWLHPKAVSYENILVGKVKVVKSAIGVPMLSGVTDKLAQIGSSGIGPPSHRGIALYPTFDYPVDLPEGIWSVRDLIGFCSVASPRTSFFAQELNGRNYIGSDIIGSAPERRVPPTALAYWQSEIDPNARGLPTEGQVLDALASENEQVRRAARKYVELCWPVLGFGATIPPFPAERALWAAVGMLSVHVRAPGVTHPAVEVVRQVLKDEENTSISPGLRALAAMEMARVSGYALEAAQQFDRSLPDTKMTESREDMKRLEQVASVALSATEVAKVKYDMIRVLRYSKTVREKLLEIKPKWSGLSKEDIQALGNGQIFSVP